MTLVDDIKAAYLHSLRPVFAILKLLKLVLPAEVSISKQLIFWWTVIPATSLLFTMAPQVGVSCYDNH